MPPMCFSGIGMLGRGASENQLARLLVFEGVASVRSIFPHSAPRLRPNFAIHKRPTFDCIHTCGCEHRLAVLANLCFRQMHSMAGPCCGPGVNGVGGVVEHAGIPCQGGVLHRPFAFAVAVYQIAAVPPHE